MKNEKMRAAKKFAKQILPITMFLSAAHAQALDLTVSPGQDIQSKVDQVVSSGGGKVTLAAGTWTLTKTLALGNNLILKGQGASILIQGPDTVYNWPLINVTTADAMHDITVDSLVVDGRIPRGVVFDPNNGYHDSLGIFFFATNKTGSRITISNVEVCNTSEGLHVKGVDGLTVKNS
ncbi:right-handed parallel beta-helix repeat-containing protein [Collimonas silvisoli]|uniref:hypothetical protein n=1 Tax=Collimonas silvisoli TaxID=2825884 RepID=UPI001B8D6C57|nr:hypothetical protein [Collimonas silvisoli]